MNIILEQHISCMKYNSIDDYLPRQATFKSLFPKGATLISILSHLSSTENCPMFSIVYDTFIHNQTMTDEILDLIIKVDHPILIQIASKNQYCTSYQLDKLVQAMINSSVNESSLLEMSENPQLSASQKNKLIEMAKSTKSRIVEYDCTLDEISVNSKKSLLRVSSSLGVGSIRLSDINKIQEIIPFLEKKVKIHVRQTIWEKNSFDSYHKSPWGDFQFISSL